jgi:8-oxo-dGTP diphosphatase
MSNVTIAAGGVIWRKNSKNEIEVVLVHRSRYDDWSLPKGKLDSGETLIGCAYRELIEETDLSIKLGPYVGEVEYFVPDGLKKVSYWAATLIGDQKPFAANQEVDAIGWFTLIEAADKATRDSDREILAKFEDIPYDTSALIMLRHAKALAREEWQGEDDDRPLDILGQQQAKRMHSIYQVYGLQQIHTSDAVRCLDTISQVARIEELHPIITSAVSEYTWKKNKDKALDYAKELIKINEQILLCSHNPVLPRMMEKLTKKIDFDYPDNKLLPGEAWVLHHDKKDVRQIERFAAPAI